jgi:hypothetical protein
MSQTKTNSMNWALILIAVALAGAGISYHFTLQSRFSAIEQKLDQNSLALQQVQIAQESIASSKSDALDHLNKEFDALQASLEPLGKATREQTESLSDIHKQIFSLQQSQEAQQDAQKKLSEYALQLDRMKREIQSQPQIPASSILVTPPATPTPAEPQASSPHVVLPLPPRADNNVDLRPAQTTTMADAAATSSVRALPVALPVDQPVADVR